MWARNKAEIWKRTYLPNLLFFRATESREGAQEGAQMEEDRRREEEEALRLEELKLIENYCHIIATVD